MDAKSLKKLNRRELLEVMVKISEQNEALEQENSMLRSQLENRRLSAREVGSLAQASLEATDLFIAADSAAKVYLENILRLEKEAQDRANRLLEETLIECINMRAAAGFGPDELLPPDWRAPASGLQAVGAPAADEGLIASFDGDAPVASIPSGETVNDKDGSQAAPDAATSADASGKKRKKGLFSRKKKDKG